MQHELSVERRGASGLPTSTTLNEIEKLIHLPTVQVIYLSLSKIFDKKNICKYNASLLS